MAPVSLRRLVASCALAVGAFTLVPPTSGCDNLSLCNRTQLSASTSIANAWCRRFVECGHADDEAACVEDRLAAFYVPDDTGCGSSCSDDTDECKRTTCDDDKVDDCAKRSQQMACADMLGNGGTTVEFPDQCFFCMK